MYLFVFVFCTSWADDSRSEPAGRVLPRPIATREVDILTQEAHHSSLHVNADKNEFKCNQNKKYNLSKYSLWFSLHPCLHSLLCNFEIIPGVFKKTLHISLSQRTCMLASVPMRVRLCPKWGSPAQMPQSCWFLLSGWSPATKTSYKITAAFISLTCPWQFFSRYWSVSLFK